jgi:hypothetical protein
MAAQPSSRSGHDIPFPMLKEHLTDVIDELVSVSNRCKINLLIEKFDTEATKAHRMMQQTQQDMTTTHMHYFNAICDVLAGHDNGDMVDNDKNHDKLEHAKAKAVDYNVQQTNNVAMEAPPCHIMRLTATKIRTSSRIQMHNRSTTPCNKESMQQRRTPYQLTHIPTTTRELNRQNLLYSRQDQMCRQRPRYRRHAAEPLLYLIVVYFANYSVLNY